MNKIETKRLIIRPLTYKMAETLLNDRKSFNEKFNIDLHPNWPLEAIKKKLDNYKEYIRDNFEEVKWGIWIMINKGDKKVIGDLGFKGKPNEEGIIEVGYSIVENYRGFGYANEGVKALINWALEDKRVNKIIAQCNENNIPSIRLLKRVGMDNVGMKDNMLQWQMYRKRQK